MSPTRLPTQWIIRAGMVLAATLGLVASCVTHERARPVCGEVLDGGTAFFSPEGAQYDASPSTDAQPVTAFGMEPDLGPSCTDCSGQAALEFMTIADFEDGFAPAWFNYGEPGIPIEPGQVAPFDAGSLIQPDGSVAQHTISPDKPYWGLQATDLRHAPGGPRCGSTYALHMSGGRFVSWGGGFATLFATIRGARNVNEQCDNVPDDRLRPPPGMPPEIIGDKCLTWMTPVEVSQGARYGVDASAFEGISFWARRGPSGQSTLRISVLDDNTSTGLALAREREAWKKRDEPSAMIPPPACERIQECCRYCNDVTYLPYDSATATVGEPVTEKRCHIPGEPVLKYRFDDNGEVSQVFIVPPDFDVNSGENPPEGSFAGGFDNRVVIYDQWRRDYKLCCPETMDQNEDDGDPKFGGAECAPYVFNFDYSSGYYCQPPAGERLPERNENRCEDGFEANVVVDTEWRLYTIPWAELRRFTPNRPPVDPRGIWKVAFYFGAGYLDTYVDDVGFYRKRR